MPIGFAIGAGLGLLGSSMQADAAESAARTSANAQLEAARIAAEAQKFRPVGITTRFGTSNFQFGIPGVSAPKQSDYSTPEEYQQALSNYQTRVAKEGYLTGAGYTLSPELAAIQDRLLSQAGGQGIGSTEQALAAQQGLFNLGQKYLAQSPEEAAQQWMTSQQAALAPARERAYNQMQQSLFNKGRSGLAVAQGAGMGAANPEAQAYYNALAQQDLNLAAQAQEQGRAQTTFGAGLFGTGAQLANAGYAPLQTQLGLGQTIEQLGQSPLSIGSELGGRAATAGANVGQTLLSAGTNAARTLQAANQYSPIGSTLQGLAGNQQLMNNIGNWFSGTNSMGNTIYNPATMNPYSQYGQGFGSLLGGTGGIGD